jgi:hypothetical protein
VGSKTGPSGISSGSTANTTVEKENMASTETAASNKVADETNAVIFFLIGWILREEKEGRIRFGVESGEK